MIGQAYYSPVTATDTGLFSLFCQGFVNLSVQVVNQQEKDAGLTSFLSSLQQ